MNIIHKLHFQILKWKDLIQAPFLVEAVLADLDEHAPGVALVGAVGRSHDEPPAWDQD